MDIDMVFTYCNGNDSNFILRKNKFLNIESKNDNPNIRFEDVGEINYSVKSVVKFLPWIRNIYIVTDRQIPKLEQSILDSSKIKIIDHCEIMPSDIIPTFNSDVIESYLHNIPGLSEIFLYNNDDCFHMDYVNLNDIYDIDTNKCKVISSTKLDIIRKKTSEFCQRILYTVDLLPNINDFVYNHVTKVCRKSTAKFLENNFSDELNKLRKYKFRTRDTIHYLFLLLNIDNYYNNNILITLENYPNLYLEYHFGNRDYDDEYDKNKFNYYKNKHKFVCYNTMNSSYINSYNKMMNECFLN